MNPQETDPLKLEARRRQIILDLTTIYRGYDDPDVPIELLRELAFITSTLRRKQSGPPRRKPQANGSKQRFTVDDL